MAVLQPVSYTHLDVYKRQVMLWKRETLTDGAARWVEPRAGDQERAEGWA